VAGCMSAFYAYNHCLSGSPPAWFRKTQVLDFRSVYNVVYRKWLAPVYNVVYTGSMPRIEKKRASKDGSSRAVAIGYCRVSTNEQVDEGVSLAQQEEAIRRYADSKFLTLTRATLPEGLRRNYPESGVFIERGISGGMPLGERPEGRKLAALLRSGKVGHLIVNKLDRLFRSAADSATWIAELDRIGVSLHLLDLGGSAVDTSTTSGKMVVGMISNFAEMMRGTIKDNTRNAMKYKASRHEYCGGCVPYGWRIVDPKADPIRLERDPAEQAVIARAVELRAAGMSYRKIGDALFKEGKRGRSGPWSVESIRRITWNPEDKDQAWK